MYINGGQTARSLSCVYYLYSISSILLFNHRQYNSGQYVHFFKSIHLNFHFPPPLMRNIYVCPFFRSDTHTYVVLHHSYRIQHHYVFSLNRTISSRSLCFLNSFHLSIIYLFFISAYHSLNLAQVHCI